MEIAPVTPDVGLRARSRVINAESRKQRAEARAMEAKAELLRAAAAAAPNPQCAISQTPATDEEIERCLTGIMRDTECKPSDRLNAIDQLRDMRGLRTSARKAEDTGDLGEVETLLGKADLHPGSSRETPAQGT